MVARESSGGPGVTPVRPFRWRAVVPAVALALALGGGTARADVTGAWSGDVLVRRSAQSAGASASLSQSGRQVTGTLTVDVADSALAGSYDVHGTQQGRRLVLSATPVGGGKLAWRAVVSADTLAGRLRIRGGGARVVGRLTLSRAGVAAVGASCDAVYAQNQATFDPVMRQVLVPVCSRCHVPGGLAQATRLRVTTSDAAATARTVAGLVDPAAPARSLIVEKPQLLVPHGGGAQLAPGSPEVALLQQWADVVAQSGCLSAVGGGGGATDAYAVQCAACHGADGSGGAGAGAPDIRCVVSGRLTDAVRRGRGISAMPAFPPSVVSDADLRDIGAKLAGLCTHRPADVYAANCATCHGPTAGGGRNADGVAGPPIGCAESGDFGEIVASGGEGMPAFPELRGAVGGLASFVHGFCAGGGGD